MIKKKIFVKTNVDFDNNANENLHLGIPFGSPVNDERLFPFEQQRR